MSQPSDVHSADSRPRGEPATPVRKCLLRREAFATGVSSTPPRILLSSAHRGATNRQDSRFVPRAPTPTAPQLDQITAEGAAALLIDTAVLKQNLQRPVDVTDYLTLAWIISSLATVGGAIGSGLEDEDTVRAAAYGYHPEPGGRPDEKSQ
jgi:hypothetical protein